MGENHTVSSLMPPLVQIRGISKFQLSVLIGHLKSLARKSSCAQAPAHDLHGGSILLFPARSPLSAASMCIIATVVVGIGPRRNAVAAPGRRRAWVAKHDRPGVFGELAMTMTGNGCAPRYRGAVRFRRRPTFSQGSCRMSPDPPPPRRRSL